MNLDVVFVIPLRYLGGYCNWRISIMMKTLRPNRRGQKVLTNQDVPGLERFNMVLQWTKCPLRVHFTTEEPHYEFIQNEIGSKVWET